MFTVPIKKRIVGMSVGSMSVNDSSNNKTYCKILILDGFAWNYINLNEHYICKQECLKCFYINKKIQQTKKQLLI